MDVVEKIHNSALAIVVSDSINNCITNQISSIPQGRINDFIRDLLDKLIKNIEFQYKSNNINEKVVIDYNLLNKISLEFANVLVKFNYANKLTKGMGNNYFNNKDVIYNNMVNNYMDNYNQIKDIICNIYGLSNNVGLDDKLNAQLALNAATTLFQEIYKENQNEEAFIMNFIDAYQGIYNSTKVDGYNTKEYNVLNLNNEAIEVISAIATDIYVRNSNVKIDYDVTKNNFINSIKKIVEKEKRDVISLPNDVLDSESITKGR